jgi:hypothetical protein
VYLGGRALPPALRDVLGDALWAAMLTWGIGALAPARPLAGRLACAAALCTAVELSQRVHAPGLDALRATRLGHLVLGSDYDARDLAAYALGIATAAGLELAVRRRAARAPVRGGGGARR